MTAPECPAEIGHVLEIALEAMVERVVRRVLRELGEGPLGYEYITIDSLPPGTSMRSLHDARRRGELPGTRSGRGWAYRTADVERWLADRTERRTQSPQTSARHSWAAQTLKQRGFAPTSAGRGR